jgi:hypothetical protein
VFMWLRRGLCGAGLMHELIEGSGRRCSAL